MKSSREIQTQTDNYALPTCISYDNHQSTETVKAVINNLRIFKTLGYKTLCIEWMHLDTDPAELVGIARKKSAERRAMSNQALALDSMGFHKLGPIKKAKLEMQKRAADNTDALADLIELGLQLGFSIKYVDMDYNEACADYVDLPDFNHELFFQVFCGEVDNDLSRDIFAKRKTCNIEKITVAQIADQNGVIALLGLRHVIHAGLTSHYYNTQLANNNLLYFHFLSTKAMVAADSTVPDEFKFIQNAQPNQEHAAAINSIQNYVDDANLEKNNGGNFKLITTDTDDNIDTREVVLTVLNERQTRVNIATYDIQDFIDQDDEARSNCCATLCRLL